MNIEDLERRPWNLRYLAYCRAHGTPDPEAMKERDAKDYPCLKMAGFLVWMAQRWAMWHALRGKMSLGMPSEDDQRDFDAWLAEGP